MVFFGRREETKSLPCAYVPVVTVENSSPLGTHALFLIIRLPAINHDAYLQVGIISIWINLPFPINSKTCPGIRENQVFSKCHQNP